jgi:DNA-binding transcriptional LysR family regulator
MIGKPISTPNFSLMLRSQAMCEKLLSIDRPSSSQSIALKSACRLAKAMNSVVHTGVKSAGCENSTREQHQPLAAVVLRVASRRGWSGRHTVEGRGRLVQAGHCLQRHALSAFGEDGLRQDPAYQATSLPTLAAMVAAGAGVTLLPAIAVRAGVAQGHDLALIPIRGAHPRHIALVWRRGSSRSAAFEALAEACATILRKAQGQV